MDSLIAHGFFSLKGQQITLTEEASRVNTMDQTPPKASLKPNKVESRHILWNPLNIPHVSSSKSFSSVKQYHSLGFKIHSDSPERFLLSMDQRLQRYSTDIPKNKDGKGADLLGEGVP